MVPRVSKNLDILLGQPFVQPFYPMFDRHSTAALQIRHTTDVGGGDTGRRARFQRVDFLTNDHRHLPEGAQAVHFIGFDILLIEQHRTRKARSCFSRW
jgi:hypothetical protein